MSRVIYIDHFAVLSMVFLVVGSELPSVIWTTCRKAISAGEGSVGAGGFLWSPALNAKLPLAKPSALTVPLTDTQPLMIISDHSNI